MVTTRRRTRRYRSGRRNQDRRRLLRGRLRHCKRVKRQRKVLGRRADRTHPLTSRYCWKNHTPLEHKPAPMRRRMLVETTRKIERLTREPEAKIR